ncbi:excisionase [Grimontia marina]|uniref:Excisionase-like domain-containing protein n=1 Tax=Grimontia marina TaxID=646534 RepID=A0A128FH89_9GAMM|nr:excisionase [Grimontia marina]CZF85930.1 hypothetical protein GMA8713_03963 [Grimontia marina]
MSNYHFIRLSDWAAAVFLGEHYSAATMSRWAKTRQIDQPPIKVGGRWMVRQDARFMLDEPTPTSVMTPRCYWDIKAGK